MFCNNCGNEIAPNAVMCPKCGKVFQELPSASSDTDIGQDAGFRLLLPVGRSGWAIAAGYLGLISVLAVPAPFALLCSIMAIRDIRKNPKKHGMGRAVFGIIMSICGPLLFFYPVIYPLIVN